MFQRSWATVVALALLAATASAQGGYSKRQYPELGIALPEARDYEQIPTQPDEEFVVLYYAEKLGKDRRPTSPVRSELSVLWIDWVAERPAPATGEAPPPPTPDGAAPKEEEGERAKVVSPVNSIGRYLEQRTPWELGRGEAGKEKDGYEGHVYTLVPKPGFGARTAGQCYVFEKPGRRTIAFLGTCFERELEEQSKIWRYIAEHAEFSEPEAADVAKLAKKYASSGLRGLEYRVGVRSKLVRGWKAEDTENFIVVYHTADQPLVRQLCSDIESIRKQYVEMFPPAGPIEAVSTVRVCKDRSEYLAYGGSGFSAGYWNSETEELVFYDATVKQKGKREFGEENTFIVLYHEAFHQYIHYSAGELPPHSWFNEGHGDYFSGADISGGKVKKIGVNPWRIRTIQRAIEEHKFVPWRQILSFEQADYYRPDRGHICYAEGWSMIYFLRTAPVVLKDPRWSKILDTYFVELKAEYSKQLGLLDAQGRENDSHARFEAGAAARKHALERAFDGVDVSTLEAEWIDYISALEFKPR